MKKMMLVLMVLVTTGIYTSKAQVRVVVRTPHARVVLRGPVRPVVVRPAVVVARPVVARRVIVAPPVAIIHTRPVVRRRVVVYR